MLLIDADGIANSVDPDQTAPSGAVWSGSALFAQAYLSENLGSLYPLQNGVYCFRYTPCKTRVLVGYTVVSMSQIPQFRDSEIPSFCQHIRFLLSNFDNFCPILFTFTPHRNLALHFW